MRNWRQLFARGFAMALASTVICTLNGCPSSPKLSGYLFHADDHSLSTAGDTVSIYVEADPNIHATILVNADNSWVYEPRADKVDSVWSDTGELPPLGFSEEGEWEPALRVGAKRGDSLMTLWHRVLYSTHKGIPIELEYQTLTSDPIDPDTEWVPPLPPRL
jgi:hypothetical protein